MISPYLVSAIVYASLFALMAIGLTFTYMTTKVPNFAYGSFVTIGLYVAYTLSRVNRINPYEGAAVAFAISAVASVLMYLGILRPLARRGSSLVSLMIATFGIDIGFIGVFGVFTDYLQSTYKLIDAKQFFQLGPDFDLGGVQGIAIVAPGVLAAITAGLYLLFTRTRFGIAMRASVENPPLARILGINVERIYTASWLLAGGFAGLAGALYTLWLPGGTNTGSDLIVEIFSSSVLGGLTSIFGAIAGGLVIGGSEDLVTIGLAQGFGYVLSGIIAALVLLTGVWVVRRRGRVLREKLGGRPSREKLIRDIVTSGQGVSGVLLLVMGVYMFVEMATGFGTDLFVAGIVNGFGANVTPFQKAIPLLIMVITLLVLPSGLVSIDYAGLVRRSKK